jgi:hypothetical protein
MRRALRSPQGTLHTPARGATGPAKPVAPTRPLWAKVPHVCKHGTCLALEARGEALWVLVRDTTGQEGWAPIGRILSFEGRRAWEQSGFG